MKLTVVLVILSTVTLHAATFAQRLSLHVKNKTLKSVLNDIRKQTGYDVLYTEDVLRAAKPVTVQLQNASINEVMNACMEGQPLQYEIDNSTVIITKLPAHSRGLRIQAQRTISGMVSDEAGNPVVGVSVQVEGNQQEMTTTDEQGRFRLSVGQGSRTLLFSSVGYKVLRHTIGSSNDISVTLMPNVSEVDEVVVVGYGTLDKRYVSSSISSVKADDLPKGMGGSSVELALRGKVSGMTVNATGSPNSNNSIQLRGIASVNAGKAPLVVVDGVPGGDISILNQEDIESIDVLKDASAGAIYGTRAAGGVLLVTTKRAKEGPVSLTYTGELNMETVRRQPEVLSAEEFVERQLGDDFGARENWYNAVVRDNPVSHRHVFNVAGGNRSARIYATVMTQDQKGISIGDGRKDYSGRINADFSLLNDMLEIKTHAEYRKIKRDERNSNGMYRMAMWMNPTIPIYDAEDESGYNVNNYFGSSAFNPVADVNLRTREGTNSWLLADAVAKLKVTQDLSISGVLGVQDRQWQYTNYVSALHNESVRANRRGEGQLGYSRTWDLSTEGYASYDKVFDDRHRLGVVGGFSFYQTDNLSFSMTNADFPVNGVGPWDMGSGIYLSDGRASMASNRAPRERLQSFFGRANYAFDDRYTATLSLRHEGSSKFGANNRWGTFWAASGAWNIRRESFMQDIDFVNELKLRVGYGVTGNNDFTPGRTVRMYASNGWWPNLEEWGIVYGSKHNVNPNLKWEEKAELNIGVDYALFDNRLFGKFDLYRRKVSDMLYEIDVSQPPAVHTKTMSNIGNLTNSGWEFEIGGVPVRKAEFEYSTSLRFSQNRTKIESIGNAGFIEVSGGGFPSPGSPGNPFRLEEGIELGQLYLKQHAGIDEEGQFLVYDQNGEIIRATAAGNESRRYLGNTIPRLFVSWDHSLRYKQWDVGIFLRSHLNFDVFNMVDMYYGLPPKSGENVLTKAFSPERENIRGEKELSDYWLEDGSFLKLDALTLGYRMDLNKFLGNQSSLRLFLSGRDLFVLTGYSGQDPDVDINGLLPGVEWINKDSLYPKTRRFTFGMQLNF